MTKCWSCDAERGDGAVFCPQCKRIQPCVSRDFFDLLDLPRSMDLDRRALEKTFRERSRSVHPDRFGNGSPIERRLALEHTTRLNDAYRTLRTPKERAEYLLSLQGVDVGGEDQRIDDPELLMEIMELREQVEGLTDEAELDEFCDTIKARHDGLIASLSPSLAEGNIERAQKILTELRFVGRLLDRIELKLEEI